MATQTVTVVDNTLKHTVTITEEKPTIQVTPDLVPEVVEVGTTITTAGVATGVSTRRDQLLNFS